MNLAKQVDRISRHRFAGLFRLNCYAFQHFCIHPVKSINVSDTRNKSPSRRRSGACSGTETPMLSWSRRVCASWKSKKRHPLSITAVRRGRFRYMATQRRKVHEKHHSRKYGLVARLTRPNGGFRRRRNRIGSESAAKRPTTRVFGKLRGSAHEAGTLR